MWENEVCFPEISWIEDKIINSFINLVFRSKAMMQRLKLNFIRYKLNNGTCFNLIQIGIFPQFISQTLSSSVHLQEIRNLNDPTSIQSVKLNLLLNVFILLAEIFAARNNIFFFDDIDCAFISIQCPAILSALCGSTARKSVFWLCRKMASVPTPRQLRTYTGALLTQYAHQCHRLANGHTDMAFACCETRGSLLVWTERFIARTNTHSCGTLDRPHLTKFVQH